MLHFIDRHKFGILATIIFHFLVIFVATYTHMPLSKMEVENLLVLNFSAEEVELPIIEKQQPKDVHPPVSNNNSNKAVNEAAPKDVESGNYNEFNKEPSAQSKESFEKQLEKELKALEDEVIQSQRDAGYGYSPEEVAKMLDTKKNDALDHVKSQEPRSEAAFKGQTNITYKLKNRFDTKLEVPVYMCQYGGMVVVNIAVDQNGSVVSAKIDEESSKTTDACLLKAALNGAKRTRFNKKTTASKIQTGSITYQFIEQ